MCELLKALESATADDLESIRQEIAKAEAHLLSLRVVEKVLATRLGVPEPPTPKGYRVARMTWRLPPN